MTEKLAPDSSIFMGVSVSNKVFNRDFVRRFLKWCEWQQIKHGLVVIFDTCEIVNTKVFHNVSEEQARKQVALRTADVTRMFSKVLPANIFTITTQSDYSLHLPKLSSILGSLRKGYEKKGKFYEDVREQIIINLSVKAERIGKEIIEQNLDALTEYIILELAWFCSFFKQDRIGVIEVYPGADLFTKRKLVQGKYKAETGLEALEKEPEYIDIGTI